MISVLRSPQNPILTPRKSRTWEREAVYNPSVVKNGDLWHMVYRAQSAPQPWANTALSIATIGYASSTDGVHFAARRQLILPSEEWERFGCEDPRITARGSTHYIFYTALSLYPFAAPGIKVALAKTDDFVHFEKHLVTPFNAKAMALFPDLVEGKLTAILTAHTDMPPVHVGIAQFEKEEELWSKEYWESWHKNLPSHQVLLTRSTNDHVEVGAAPLKTKEGWLLIYCYIYNYFAHPATFAIEAVLLEGNNPRNVLGRCHEPILIPQEHYELYGKVPNVIFPSGGVFAGDELSLYYGAADTTCCLAYLSLKSLLSAMIPVKNSAFISTSIGPIAGERALENPIISPVKDHTWECNYTFNPAALSEGGKIHLLYRAMGEAGVSTFGLATSLDGVHIQERLSTPVYLPRQDFEKPKRSGNSGCEDPRLTRLGERIYMCYTAFNGVDPPRIALTSISVAAFLDKKWEWEKPILISPPGVDDKDGCLLPEKVEGKFVFLHRFNPSIWIASVEHLTFGGDNFLGGDLLLEPRVYSWDSDKIGIGPPPIKTTLGWLLIYHGLSRYSKKYRLGAALLALEKPRQVIARLDYPILEPTHEFEKKGLRPDTVFSCGAVTQKDTLFVYYGAGDEVVCVATLSLSQLLVELSRSAQ